MKRVITEPVLYSLHNRRLFSRTRSTRRRGRSARHERGARRDEREKPIIEKVHLVLFHTNKEYSLFIRQLQCALKH